MELFTRVSGCKVKMLEMEEVYKFGPMALGTMVFGKTVWLMAEAVLSMLMVMFTKVSGLKIKLMDMEFNKIITEVDTRVSGKTTNNMVME